MARERLLGAKHRDSTPYVYRSNEHWLLRKTAESGVGGVLIYGTKGRDGVTRTLREFLSELHQMRWRDRLESVSMVMDFLTLDPIAVHLRILASMRNAIVNLADAALKERGGIALKLPDSFFKHFDALFDLCWIAIISDHSKADKPELVASAFRVGRVKAAKYVLRLATGGLVDMIVDSDELIDIVKSVCGDLVTDGVAHVSDETYHKIALKYRERARKSRNYYDRRYASVFEAAFPEGGPPNLHAMYDLLTLFFTDPLIEVLKSCFDQTKIFMIFDAIDEFDRSVGHEVRLRQAICEILAEAAAAECGVAMGSRKRPKNWSQQIDENLARGFEEVILDELKKEQVENYWRVGGADSARADRAVKIAFSRRRQTAIAGALADAWIEAGDN